MDFTDTYTYSPIVILCAGGILIIYRALTDDNPISEYFSGTLVVVAVTTFYLFGVYWAILLTILSGLALTYFLIWTLTKMMQWAVHH